MQRNKAGHILMSVLLVVAAVIMLPLVASAQDGDSPEPMASVAARATLGDAEGNLVGEVIVLPFGEGQFLVQASATGLTPGFHGFHIHTTGACDASGDTPFSSAGPHMNPDGTSHPEHAGDLPTLYVTEAGTASLTVVTDRFTLEDLFDDDGSAVIVHGGMDNYANIPERYGGPDEETLGAGDAGPRVACGVFESGAPAAEEGEGEAVG